MAWLHAVPKPPPGTKRSKRTDELPKISRAEQMKRDGLAPSMPPNPVPHIITRLIELGISESRDMGSAPLSWREIQAWQEGTGIQLSPWEAKLIRSLSVEYLAQLRKSESENCPAPWRTEVTQREVEVEQARLEMVLG